MQDHNNYRRKLLGTQHWRTCPSEYLSLLEEIRMPLESPRPRGSGCYQMLFGSLCSLCRLMLSTQVTAPLWCVRRRYDLFIPSFFLSSFHKIVCLNFCIRILQKLSHGTDSRLIPFQLPHTDRSPLSQVVTRRCLLSKFLELSLWWKRSFCIPGHLYSIEECLVYNIPDAIDFIFQRMEAVGQFRNKMGCYYRPSVCCSRSFCSQCSTWWAAGPPQTLLLPHPGLGTRHQRSSCA